MEAVSFMWFSIEVSIFSISVDMDRREGIREAEYMAFWPTKESISTLTCYTRIISYHAAPLHSVISLLGWRWCSSASHPQISRSWNFSRFSSVLASAGNLRHAKRPTDAKQQQGQLWAREYDFRTYRYH